MTTGRLLIVDDEEILRSALGGLFRRDGWQVATAATGTEALALLAESRFDILLLDLKMPGMSGQEVCRRVAESWPEMFVFAISGYVSREEAEHLAENLGVVEVFRKPAELSVLRESLLRALE